MTTTLTDVRDAAVQLRDNADNLVKNIDDLLSNPAGFDSSWEQLKEQVLHTFLGTKLPPTTQTTKPAPQQVKAARPRGRYACDICATQGKRYTAKNDAGLAIHKGRIHGRKAEREKLQKMVDEHIEQTSKPEGDSWEYSQPEGERVPA